MGKSMNEHPTVLYVDQPGTPARFYEVYFNGLQLDMDQVRYADADLGVVIVWERGDNGEKRKFNMERGTLEFKVMHGVVRILPKANSFPWHHPAQPALQEELKAAFKTERDHALQYGRLIDEAKR